MSLEIKLALVAGAVALAAIAGWYVQGLRADNAALAADNARLLAVSAVNEAVIVDLQDQRQRDDSILTQWAEEKAALLKTQERLAMQIQKEAQSNENFKTWTAGVYNADAYRLLQSANNHRVSDHQTDAARPVAE